MQIQPLIIFNSSFSAFIHYLQKVTYKEILIDLLIFFFKIDFNLFNKFNYLLNFLITNHQRHPQDCSSYPAILQFYFFFIIFFFIFIIQSYLQILLLFFLLNLSDLQYKSHLILKVCLRFVIFVIIRAFFLLIVPISFFVYLKFNELLNFLC